MMMTEKEIAFFAERIIDHNGVRNFANAMCEKLDRKRDEGKGGWNDPSQCSIDDLRSMLIEHVDKGDMVDIANFAMMIWNREKQLGAKK